MGESIRRVLLDSKTTQLRPLSELLLYYASRHQNLCQNVLPALGEGKLVLCDRYADASMAYQGYGRGIDLATIAELNRIAISRMPDLTILIDIDPALSLGRARERNRHEVVDESRFEKESLEFYTRVRNGYLEMASKEPRRFRLLQGNQSIAGLHQKIIEIIDPLLENPNVA